MHVLRNICRIPVSAPLMIAVVSSAAVLLVSVVGIHLASLLEIWSREPAPMVIAAGGGHGAVHGRLHHRDGRWSVHLSGPPGATCVVADDRGVTWMVNLDDSGSGELHHSEWQGPAPSLRLSRFTGRPVVPVVAEEPTPPPEPGTTPTPRIATQQPIARRSTPPERPAATPATAALLGTVAPSPVATAPRLRATGPSPPILHLVHDGGPRIAITFDGGSSSNGTVDFLDFLARTHLDVTLFLTGQFIEREPGLVRRAVLAGHEVGNHTYSHLHLTTYAADRRHRLLPEVTEEVFKEELRRTERAYFVATGRRLAPLWRAPYGEENADLRAWAFELGYLHVRWSSLRGASLDSRDWVADEHSGMYQEADRMMTRLMSFPRLEGGIVLMHLSSERSEPPWNHLPVFLEQLAERRIEPVQVTTLLEASPTWKKWLHRARTQHQKVWGTVP